MADFYALYPPSSGGSSANASVSPTGDPVPSDATLIGGENGSGDLTAVSVDNSGRINVNSTGLPTSLGQKTMANSTSVAIASDQSTVPVSVSGVSTAANQVTEIASLSSIDTKLSSQATAANQATEIASLSSIDGKTPALGQAVMASSSPVVIASNQSDVPVSIASLPLPSGAATEATLSSFSAKSSSSDVHEAYDYRAFTYVGITQKIDTITYKFGGSGGTTVATQTFGYDGSDRLTSITKS